VRRTRLGADVSGPPITWYGGATTGGRVEIDFEGSFVIENKAGVLLRHAYWEAKNDDFRVLIGQTSDVISPLYPDTLNYSVGWFGGNIGYRRAQFRLERYFHLSHASRLIVQGSLNQTIVPDFAADPGVRREPSGWPVIEGRVALEMGAMPNRSPSASPRTLAGPNSIFSSPGRPLWIFHRPTMSGSTPGRSTSISTPHSHRGWASKPNSTPGRI